MTGGIDIATCDRLPPKAQLDEILAEYYHTVVTRLRAAGVPVEPSVPQSALEEFWAYRDDYLPPNGCMVIARDAAGEVVDCGMMKRFDAETRELKRLFVRETARGTGTGRKLVEARIEVARQMGLRRLVADTLSTNVEMRRLYPKLGFVETSAPIETSTHNDQVVLQPHLHYFVLHLDDAASEGRADGVS